MTNSTLTGTKNLSEKVPQNNVCEGVLHILQSSRTRASSSDIQDKDSNEGYCVYKNLNVLSYINEIILMPSLLSSALVSQWFVNTNCGPCWVWPVGWGCRIHWLNLWTGVRPSPMSVLDITLNNLMMRLQCYLGMQSAPSLPLLPGPPGPAW